MTPFDKYTLTYANCALQVGCAFRLYLVGLTINTNSTTTTTASTSPIQLTVSDDLKHQTDCYVLAAASGDLDDATRPN